MDLVFHSNNVAKEGKAGIWIFQGPSLVAFVACSMAAIFLFRVQANYDVELPINLAVSLSPIFVLTVFVFLLVVGKPASYAMDLLLSGAYRVQAAIYKAGFRDQPPVLWNEPKRLSHPSEF